MHEDRAVIADRLDDHSPLTHANARKVATRESPDIERPILGQQTIERTRDALLRRAVKPTQFLLGSSREEQSRLPAGHAR